MIRLHINPAFSALLQDHHLGSYHEVMQSEVGEIVEENEHRDVRRLQLAEQTIYLKRTKSEKASSAFESYSRLRLAHSKPFKEMLHFKYLADLGFDVAEVVAVGEDLRFAIPQRGFIMTAEVSGEDLSQLYLAAGERDRQRILGQFGTLLGRLHSHGFYGSTRLKDIIYAGKPDANSRLTLIDRETRNPYPKRATTKRIIERLLINIRRQAQQGEIFSESQWGEFCDNYCDSLSSHAKIQNETLLARILASLQHNGKIRQSA